MISSIRFLNFKSLRDATLPLGRFTLLVGPNGSGKSSALQALAIAAKPTIDWGPFRTVGVGRKEPVQFRIQWKLEGHTGYSENDTIVTVVSQSRRAHEVNGAQVSGVIGNTLEDLVASIGVSPIYALDAQQIASTVMLVPNAQLAGNGHNLAAVLDRLRDQTPEGFEELNDELGRWLPQFDRILFDTPASGNRSISLRTRHGHHAIPATQLSQGELFAMALLTLTSLPENHKIIGLEEPERGIHPRLLRDVRDAIYRLCYPEEFNDKRPPVQVVATTHSPAFLDLFRDNPGRIVLAHKTGLEAHFTPLTEYKDLHDILEGSRLGDVWYSGILGGIPSEG